jgi:hypothetical protein
VTCEKFIEVGFTIPTLMLASDKDIIPFVGFILEVTVGAGEVPVHVVVTVGKIVLHPGLTVINKLLVPNCNR